MDVKVPHKRRLASALKFSSVPRELVCAHYSTTSLRHQQLECAERGPGCSLGGVLLTRAPKHEPRRGRASAQ
jgi:hypothetical protein